MGASFPFNYLLPTPVKCYSFQQVLLYKCNNAMISIVQSIRACCKLHDKFFKRSYCTGFATCLFVTACQYAARRHHPTMQTKKISSGTGGLCAESCGCDSYTVNTYKLLKCFHTCFSVMLANTICLVVLRACHIIGM